ncbi:MAG TPA: hypothetical protein VGQ02_04755 [Candidatus Limnocylindrales bacterium]|jgi:hypothetical protein|nr:hypothetical protein [Candidatus Limnocylindrales bacterium]
MSAVGNGAQWASRRIIPALVVNALAFTLVFVTIFAVARLSSTSAATDFLLGSRSEILSRPISGAAWAAITAAADATPGSPDITCNQDQRSHPRATLAAALVYARTGLVTYRDKAIELIEAAYPTARDCGNAILSLGRQLGAYVLAADFAGYRDASFVTWLRNIRTRSFPSSHSRWYTLAGTAADSANNWGTFALASLTAADAYLGDTTGLARDWALFKDYGDGTASFLHTPSYQAVWSCPAGYEINPASCSDPRKEGAAVEDASRSTFPTIDGYPAEAAQGYVVQAEILSRAGYAAWTVNDRQICRNAKWRERLGNLNHSSADHYVTWLTNARCGFTQPTQAAGFGRVFGFTDWLYGPGTAIAGTPAPTRSPSPTPGPTPTSPPTPTPGPTSTSTPNASADPTSGPAGDPSPSSTDGPTSTPTTVPDATPSPTSAPTPEPTATPTKPPTQTQSAHPPRASRPIIKLSASSVVPTSGVPVLVDWGLASSDNGLRGYQLQVRVADGAWRSVALASATSSLARRPVPPGVTIRFRVRAIDRVGTIGDWVTSAAFRAAAISDSSSAIRWSSSWSFASHVAYLGHRVHYTKTRGATATITFSGSAIAWAGPVGPTRGKARVFLDGHLVTTVDLYRSGFAARDMVFARNVPNGTHTLRIQALGTSGRPTVAVDGLYVIWPL